MLRNRSDFRNTVLCIAIAMAALLLAWPFADTPFNDDWTWALTVKQLNATGHLVYNGWSSPSVIAQGYWGLLWVKVFGFSFNVLRVSSLPMAAGCVAVSYLLGRRAGLNAALAFFAALTLGLSPLFMPLEASFMTDVPGLFFLLFSLYALTRGHDDHSVGWIFTGAIVALIGGSSRQVVWIVPLITLPYFAWLRRTDRSFAIAAVAAWLLVFLGAVAMQHWFGQQPYAVPDPPLTAYLREAGKHPGRQFTSMLWVFLTIMLSVLPISLAAVRRLTITKLALSGLIFLVLVAITHHFRRVMMPWMQNMITVTGVLGSNELGGDRPIFLTHSMRYTLSIAVFASTALLIASALLWAREPAAAIQKTMTFLLKPPNQRATVQAILLTSVAYLGLEWTRCIFAVGFDRHLVPLIPFVGISFLLCLQQAGLAKIPALSWFALAVFSIYSIGMTSEFNALARARVTAVQRLKAAGFADSQIDAGFEHNYWTEADQFGHINDARLLNPPDAYDKTKGPLAHSQFAYRLERKPTVSTTSTPFGQVDYFSPLPPFHRWISIDRFVDPWWLNPARAATQPVAKQILPKLLIDQYRQ